MNELASFPYALRKNNMRVSLFGTCDCTNSVLFKPLLRATQKTTTTTFRLNVSFYIVGIAGVRRSYDEKNGYSMNEYYSLKLVLLTNSP